MALRPIALLALLTLTALAGCSDGPPSGDLTAKPGPVTVDGSTTVNTYVAESGGQANPLPVGDPRVCADAAPELQCVDASSNYFVHFMSLPEPDGQGYALYQMGGAIGERQLQAMASLDGVMYEANITREEDESTQFDRFELRMGTFVMASASSAAGSQAFVADPGLSSTVVTGSYKGHTLTLDISGLPGEKIEYVGRLYTQAEEGAELVLTESFPVFNGGIEYESKDHDIGDFAEFHIHVGNSKVYVYQGTLG